MCTSGFAVMIISMTIMYPCSAQVVIQKSLKKLMGTRMCNQRDDRAPCACKSQLTDYKLTKISGETVTVEFIENVCLDEVNEKRVDTKVIAPGYKCSQLFQRKKMYQDNDGGLIFPPESISYRSSCELRCVHSKCLLPKRR